jgi:hypothetical protein
MPHRIVTDMHWQVCRMFILVLCAGCATRRVQPERMAGPVWRFAVSGDSRNCGDVVMPAIAADALQHQIAFYWHLGDFRKGTDVDEDMQQQYHGNLSLADYQRDAWGDFLAHEIAPFGLLPVYLGIGNHELYMGNNPGKSRADYLAQFAHWLDLPDLRAQRLSDNPTDTTLTSYYHWQHGGVDFIYLDNASEDGFEPAQMDWLESVLARDKSDPNVHAVVAGMHRALPNSLACGHSMNGDRGHENEHSIKSGRQTYRDLLQWNKESGKPVYVLASHSHFFIEGTFSTPYWNSRGVLPGWIIGTAGARRYPLPRNLPPGIQAKTQVSGYLLGTVAANGEIQFTFQELAESAVPDSVKSGYGEQFVDWCFRENGDNGTPATPPDSCYER